MLLCTLPCVQQVNAAAAAKAFDTCLATWQGAVPGQQQAALAAAQHELAAVVKATHAVAEEQVAKARLEKERQLDDMQRAAMKAAVDKYKEAMGAMAQNSSSEAAVRSKHQVRAFGGDQILSSAQPVPRCVCLCICRAAVPLPRMVMLHRHLPPTC